MALEFLVTDQDREAIGAEALAVLAEVYATCSQHPHIQVDLSLVSLEEMQEINREQRQLDEPTDVLSFPSYPDPEAIEAVPHEMPLLLGAIVISPDKAVMYEETLPQLVHHGLIHLLGYDHETDLSAWRAMEHPLVAQLATKGLIIPEVPDHD
jgi:probable rRNA maturation factor